jgi:hypothetical protein
MPDSHPEERTREPRSTATTSPSGTPSPESNPCPFSTAGVEPATRSAGSTLAVVLTALVLTVTLGISFKAREESPVPAASTDAAEAGDRASDGPPTAPVSPLSALEDVGPIEPATIGTVSRRVEGVRFSFRVPGGWEGFGNTSINKSVVGPQGAEAIIFWASFPVGDTADPCAYLLSSPVGSSVADLAAAVATAPGTELIRGPSDVTVDGYPAKHVVITVRRDAGCDPGYFYKWQDIEGGALWPMTKAADTIRVWIVDVNGTLLFIEAETTNQASPDLEQEIHQIVESIRFD